MSRIVILSLLVFLLLCTSAQGQRFSLLAEVGGMRTQIDGDKIQGFFYNGYTVGIGTNYAINAENYLSVKTSFNKQGSRRKDRFQPNPRIGVQLELDLNTIGLEFGYKYDPADRSFFIGCGLIRHQLVGLRTEVFETFDPDEVAFALNDEQLATSYFSFKVLYGTNLFSRAEGYLAFEVAVTDILEVQQLPIRTLTPYAISAVFTYEIIAPKIEKQKKRPGTKSRNINRAKKTRRK